MAAYRTKPKRQAYKKPPKKAPKKPPKGKAKPPKKAGKGKGKGQSDEEFIAGQGPVQYSNIGEPQNPAGVAHPHTNSGPGSSAGTRTTSSGGVPHQGPPGHVVRAQTAPARPMPAGAPVVPPKSPALVRNRTALRAYHKRMAQVHHVEQTIAALGKSHEDRKLKQQKLDRERRLLATPEAKKPKLNVKAAASGIERTVAKHGGATEVAKHALEAGAAAIGLDPGKAAKALRSQSLEDAAAKRRRELRTEEVDAAAKQARRVWKDAGPDNAPFAKTPAQRNLQRSGLAPSEARYTIRHRLQEDRQQNRGEHQFEKERRQDRKLKKPMYSHYQRVAKVDLAKHRLDVAENNAGRTLRPVEVRDITRKVLKSPTSKGERRAFRVGRQYMRHLGAVPEEGKPFIERARLAAEFAPGKKTRQLAKKALAHRAGQSPKGGSVNVGKVNFKQRGPQYATPRQREKVWLHREHKERRAEEEARVDTPGELIDRFTGQVKDIPKTIVASAAEGFDLLKGAGANGMYLLDKLAGNEDATPYDYKRTEGFLKELGVSDPVGVAAKMLGEGGHSPEEILSAVGDAAMENPLGALTDAAGGLSLSRYAHGVTKYGRSGYQHVRTARPGRTIDDAAEAERRAGMSPRERVRDTRDKQHQAREDAKARALAAKRERRQDKQNVRAWRPTRSNVKKVLAPMDDLVRQREAHQKANPDPRYEERTKQLKSMLGELRTAVRAKGDQYGRTAHAVWQHWKDRSENPDLSGTARADAEWVADQAQRLTREADQTTRPARDAAADARKAENEGTTPLAEQPPQTGRFYKPASTRQTLQKGRELFTSARGGDPFNLTGRAAAGYFRRAAHGVTRRVRVAGQARETKLANLAHRLRNRKPGVTGRLQPTDPLFRSAVDFHFNERIRPGSEEADLQALRDNYLDNGNTDAAFVADELLADAKKNGPKAVVRDPAVLDAVHQLRGEGGARVDPQAGTHGGTGLTEHILTTEGYVNPNAAARRRSIEGPIARGEVAGVRAGEEMPHVAGLKATAQHEADVMAAEKAVGETKKAAKDAEKSVESEAETAQAASDRIAELDHYIERLEGPGGKLTQKDLLKHGHKLGAPNLHDIQGMIDWATKERDGVIRAERTRRSRARSGPHERTIAPEIVDEQLQSLRDAIRGREAASGVSGPRGVQRVKYMRELGKDLKAAALSKTPRQALDKVVDKWGDRLQRAKEEDSALVGDLRELLVDASERANALKDEIKTSGPTRARTPQERDVAAAEEALGEAKGARAAYRKGKGKDDPTSQHLGQLEDEVRAAARELERAAGESEGTLAAAASDEYTASQRRAIEVANEHYHAAMENLMHAQRVALLVARDAQAIADRDGFAYTTLNHFGRYFKKQHGAGGYLDPAPNAVVEGADMPLQPYGARGLKTGEQMLEETRPGTQDFEQSLVNQARLAGIIRLKNEYLRLSPERRVVPEAEVDEVLAKYGDDYQAVGVNEDGTPITAEKGQLGPKKAKGYVIVHNQVVDVWKKTIANPGRIQAGLTAASQFYVSAILPFSAVWHMGNQIDLITRLIVSGANPFTDKQIAGALRHQMMLNDPIKGAEMFDHLQGHFGSRSSVIGQQRIATALASGKSDLAKAVKKGLEDFHRSGAGKAVVPLRELTQQGFNAATWMEEPWVGMAAGRAARSLARDMNIVWKGHMDLAEKLAREIDKAPDGGRQLIEEFGNRTLEIVGDYGANSVHAKLFQGIDPFWTWMREANKFIFVTLPFNHPIKLLLAAHGAQMAWDSAERLGLNQFTTEAMQNLPGFLTGAFPVPGMAGWFRPSAPFTSWGEAQRLLDDPFTYMADRPFPYVQRAGAVALGYRPYDPLGSLLLREGQESLGVHLPGFDAPGYVLNRYTGNKAEGVAGELLQSFLPGAQTSYTAEVGGFPTSESNLFHPEAVPGTTVPWYENPAINPFGRRVDLGQIPTKTEAEKAARKEAAKSGQPRKVHDDAFSIGDVIYDQKGRKLIYGGESFAPAAGPEGKPDEPLAHKHPPAHPATHKPKDQGPDRVRVAKFMHPVKGPLDIIATAADHAARPLGNWQSDNAIDIAVPTGTPVVAARAGRVEKVYRSSSDPSSLTAGWQVTVGGNTFYTHLRDVGVKEGDTLEPGQLIGHSGAANNVEHLHFAVSDGDPAQVIDQPGKTWVPAGPGEAHPAARTGHGDDVGKPNPPQKRRAIEKIAAAHPELAEVDHRGPRAIAEASRKYDIPPEILASIFGIESDYGRSSLEGVARGTENSSGAGGPMQFLRSSWDAYGVDGDGDGVADRYNVVDAIHSAANLLKTEGGSTPEGLRGAIFSYNHADWYVDDVLEGAQKYRTNAWRDAGTGAAMAGLGVPHERPWMGSQRKALKLIPPNYRDDARHDKRTPEENASVEGASDSDHLTTNTGSYAADIPVDPGAYAKLRRELGLPPATTGEDSVTKDGYRYQLIYGAQYGHGDHIHLGVRWVGSGVPDGTMAGAGSSVMSGNAGAYSAVAAAGVGGTSASMPAGFSSVFPAQVKRERFRSQQIGQFRMELGYSLLRGEISPLEYVQALTGGAKPGKGEDGLTYGTELPDLGGAELG